MYLRPENVRLLATAGGGVFLDRVFDHFTGFTGELLNPANQFLLPAFGVTKIIIRELRPFLFQFAFGDVPVAFDFECGHIISSFWFYVFSAVNMKGKCSGCYLRARLIHRVCPIINVSATITPAKMQAATSTSTSQVLLSMTMSMTCQACGRYGVFTPADDFSGGRLKWRSSLKTTIVCGIEMRILEHAIP